MRFLIWLFVWVGLVSAASLQKSVTIEGKYYFTPALANERVAIFGYISKFKPTKKEIEEQRKLLKRLIDEGIEREYGGWNGYEKALKKSAKEATKGAPDWLKHTLPPKVVEEAAPLLMKGALWYAMSHPELSAEPLGNVGECGVVILHEDGRYHTIKLGIDQPVVWIAFSPDGRYAAVLSDASVEKDRLYVFGKIDIISLDNERIVKSYLLANVADQIRFTPDGRYLAFMVQNPKKWSQKALRFIDLRSFNITSKTIPFEAGTISHSIHVGKNYKEPIFLFSYDSRVVCMRDRGYGLTCRLLDSKRKIYEDRGGGLSFDLSPSLPYLFNDKGELIDLKSHQVLYRYKKSPAFKRWPLEQVRFQKGERVVIRNIMGKLYLFERGRVLAQTKGFGLKSKHFFLSPEAIVSFERDGNGLVTYHGYLKREKSMLRLYDPKTLKLLDEIRFAQGSVVDAAATGDRLFVSGFDSIRIYRFR